MKFFDNLKIKNKILATYSIFILILAVVSVVIFSNNSILENDLIEEGGLVESYKTSNFLEQKISDHLNWGNQLLESIAINEQFKGQLDPHKCSFGQWYYSTTKPSDITDAEWRNLGEQHQHLHESALEVNKMILSQTENSQIVNYYKVSIKPILTNVKGIITGLSELTVNHANTSNEEMLALFSKSNTILTILVISALIIVVLVTWFTSKNLSNPITRILERVTQLKDVCITNLGNGLVLMAKGDLDAKVEKATKPLEFTQTDEIGELANVIDDMIYKAQGGIDAYENVRHKIQELISETNKLIDDSKNGLLENRGDVNRFEGVYKEIVQGVNDMLAAILNPIMDGAAVLEEMSKGNLTARVVAEYKNDHRKIQNSINQLGDSLENVLRDVAEAVHATASASSQISSSSEEMAAGAQEQSSQATEVAGAVEQMTSTILETTKNASQAASEAKNAGQIAAHGGKVVQDTVEGMQRISEVVAKAAGTVKDLGKSSDKIGEIVQVIDDIADQTNLLALNAAIEAARAGEQGRGFAVVADEVRKLAERTTKATKEIAQMITRIQSETGGAVKSIDEGTTEVEKGRELADQAGKALKQIIESSNRVGDVINQVATASEEQSTAAEQISKNIESISSVTQQSAAGTQQIARASEDLNNLTINLQNLISQFKISLSKESSGKKRNKNYSEHEGAKVSDAGRLVFH